MSAILVPGGERPVSILAGSTKLPGTLAWPTHPAGIVLFAHTGGSPPRSQLNAALARQLRSAGLGTLLFELLTDTESRERSNTLDIDLLAARLLDATEWTARQAEADGMALGYFGAGTGAAAAFVAAAHSKIPIEAVVSRCGRLDLVHGGLERITAPTLLLASPRIPRLVELNRRAFERLCCIKQLVLLPRAGDLVEIGQWASEWFVIHLAMERTWQAARA